VTGHQALAGILDEATQGASAVPQLSATTPLTLADAYAVQRAGIDLREQRGEAVVGVKLGFTSKAKAAQMGVFDLIMGTLTDALRIEDGGTVDPATFIHPRIEPEVAFRLRVDVDPLDPRAEVSPGDLDIAPALELIDSRYRDFRFTLEDVVADNTSAAGFVVGPWRALVDAQRTLDVGNLGVVLEVDGAIVDAGSTAAILGDPLRALPAVVAMARTYGVALTAGSVILAGAATPAIPLPTGAGACVEARVTGLGSATVVIGGGS